jgi:hypothetical protein
MVGVGGLKRALTTNFMLICHFERRDAKHPAGRNLCLLTRFLLAPLVEMADSLIQRLRGDISEAYPDEVQFK